MNIAATDSYRAVPSILIVAPNGSTKLTMRLGRPAFRSAHSIEMGKVAELEDVVNAVAKAELICLVNANGRVFPTTLRSRGRIPAPWISSPRSTTTIYLAKGFSTPIPVWPTMSAISANTPRGASRMTRSVILSIPSFRPSKKPIRGCPFFPSVVSTAPKSSANAMMGSTSASARA